MGEKITLNITKREVFGKKVRALRRQGITPGVVYGFGMEAMPIQAEAREVLRVYRAAGKHAPVQLAGSKRRIAMIKNVELNPIKSEIIRHISFHAVRTDEPVVAEIPIRLSGVGGSEAERAGLVVLQSLEKIEVKALPMDLPEALEVSISGLVKEGDRVTVGDIVLPAGVELIEHDDGREGTADDDVTVKDLVIASVYEPGALAAANEAAAGEAESADAEQVEVASGNDGTEDEKTSE
ncbi:MAG: 50S ribosomal protein L25 [Candidatus Nanogingivalaceae bacterium]|jgi:ribosomal protein L25, ctc-form|nr:50S ribosomal protein L25 [Candidatus Nanogingivalaceae bacterium]MCD1275526.1 50S ribosomal protein L25 [Candidatus Nanogingivalaceae bacterium]